MHWGRACPESQDSAHRGHEVERKTGQCSWSDGSEGQGMWDYCITLMWQDVINEPLAAGRIWLRFWFASFSRSLGQGVIGFHTWWRWGWENFVMVTFFFFLQEGLFSSIFLCLKKSFSDISVKIYAINNKIIPIAVLDAGIFYSGKYYILLYISVSGKCPQLVTAV